MKQKKYDLKWFILLGLIIIAIYYVAIVYIEIQEATAEEQEPDKYWNVPIIRNGYELEKIPVYYVDEPFLCEDYVGLARGCFVHGATGKYVKLVESMEFDWANQGCTVHDHEFYHAMGYSHGTGPLSTTCTNPDWEFYRNDNPLKGMYEINNVHHWDPNYEFHGWGEQNPRLIKWK